MIRSVSLGLRIPDYVNGVGGNRYGLDPLFSAFQSYPKYWLKDDSGNVVYGSITEVNQDLHWKGLQVCMQMD